MCSLNYWLKKKFDRIWVRSQLSLVSPTVSCGSHVMWVKGAQVNHEIAWKPRLGQIWGQVCWTPQSGHFLWSYLICTFLWSHHYPLQNMVLCRTEKKKKPYNGFSKKVKMLLLLGFWAHHGEWGRKKEGCEVCFILNEAEINGRWMWALNGPQG